MPKNLELNDLVGELQDVAEQLSIVTCKITMLDAKNAARRATSADDTEDK